MPIPREAIDPDADKVVRRLKRHGHAAFLVGGCVRDLLLGRTPKDFDVATSATPPETKDLFRNCRIIGRRFRLAHIFFGSKIIETSTFRANPREGVPLEEVEELLIRRDNVFGTAEDDAKRRDFTINGLFYDVEAGEVIDYVGGLADLEARLVRTIGDPDIRFREDPVRILRAIKFAARLDFQIEEKTYQAMLTHRGEIPKCAPPRVLEEIYRLLRGGAARRSMELLLETGVAATLAPELAWLLGGEKALVDGLMPTMLPPWLGEEAQTAALRERAWRVLDQLDHLIASEGKDAIVAATASNSLVLLALTAPFLPDGKAPEGEHAELATRIEEILHPLVQRLRVSRRDVERARQALLAQRRLLPARRRRSRPMALVKRDYFPEALTIYEMLSLADGEVRDEIARWKSMWRSAQKPAKGGGRSGSAGWGGGEARAALPRGGDEGPAGSMGSPPPRDESRRAERPREPAPAEPAPGVELERSVAAEADLPRPIWDEEGAPAPRPQEAGLAGERKRRRRRRGGRRRRRGGGAAAIGGGPLAAGAEGGGSTDGE